MDIKLDEYGTTLDDPYVVRCAKGFGWWYTDYDDEGEEIDKHFRVEEGTEWDIDSYGDENDVLLYGDEGYIEITWEDLDAHFELVHGREAMQMGVMEQLRRELDAAGVRYVGTHTVTASSGGVSHTATERDGLVSVSTYRVGLTPEQAARVMRSES